MQPRGRMVRNLMHLGFGQVTTTLLTILTSATLARAISAADFGLLTLAGSIAVFAYVIVDWGHGNFIIRESARSPDRSGDLLGSALFVRSICALLACPAAFAATWFLGYDLRTRVLASLIILFMLPQSLALSFGWVFRAQERMDRDAQLNVLFKLSVLVAALVCIALGGDLLWLMISNMLAGAVALGLAAVMYRRLRLPRLVASRSTARELLRDSSPMFVTALAVSIEPLINTNILYKLAAPEVVGWYGIAMTIGGTLIAPATILGATMYPRLSTVAGDTTAFKRAFDVALRPILLLSILGAIGTHLFAELPIGLIYGMEKFGPAAETLRAFAPALLLMYVDVFLSMAVLAAGRAGRLAVAKVISIAVTTALVFILVPFCQARYGNGALGPMYAMALGELLMLGFFVKLIREAIDRRTITYLSRAVLAGAATVLLLELLPTLSPLLAIPLCVGAFGVFSLLVGAVSRSDIDTLLAAIQRKPPIQ